MNRQKESKDVAKDEQAEIKMADVTLAELLYWEDEDIRKSNEKQTLHPCVQFKLGKDHVILQPDINHHTVNKNEQVYENLKKVYSDPTKANELKELALSKRFLCKDFVIGESEEYKENIHPVVLTGKVNLLFLRMEQLE